MTTIWVSLPDLAPSPRHPWHLLTHNSKHHLCRMHRLIATGDDT
jgi:hypothetical protein